MSSFSSNESQMASGGGTVRRRRLMEADGGWWRPSEVRRSSITSVCDCGSSTPRRWDKARPSHVSVLSVRLCRRSHTVISLSTQKHTCSTSLIQQRFKDGKVIKPTELLMMQFALSLFGPSVSLSELNFFIQLLISSGRAEWGSDAQRPSACGRSADDPTTTTTASHTGYRSIDQMIDHRMLQFVWRVDL